MVRFTCTALVFCCLEVVGQGPFAPQVGEPGSTGIPKDSSCFRGWAISCSLQRGFQRIDVPDSGQVDGGAAVYAVGEPNAPQVVSLGDSGVATLQFSAPFYDGEGYDFAVFENGFGTGGDAFLEFAFVEVSSDGEHFFRFPALSELPTDEQTAAFGTSDASYVHNLAGKYTVNYGVPFDLADIPDDPDFDRTKVTHVRVVDVIGTIDSAFASFDSEGRIINDPWPTSFSAGGFDLDAVGIINSTIPLGMKDIGMRVQQAKRIDILGRNSTDGELIIDDRGNKTIQMK